MQIYDTIYGEYELPKWLEPFMSSVLSKRARNITLGIIPNQFLPFSLPSRFHHGLGVLYLALQVVKNNPHLTTSQLTLIFLSALYHDYGNPPFAHLSEPLMKKFINHNGESYLEVLLSKHKDDRKLIEDCNIDIKDLVAMICGKNKPFSDIIHGSLDIDNLDNINRYAISINRWKSWYNPVTIAKHFRWNGEEWIFEFPIQERGILHQQIVGWMDARKSVYENAYGEPHLIIASMLSSVLYYLQNDIAKSKLFFTFTDQEALNYLSRKAYCQDSVALGFLNRLKEWRFLHRVYTYKSSSPSQRLKGISIWDNRFVMACIFAKQNNLPVDAVTVYLGQDRIGRSVKIPLSEINGERYMLNRNPYDNNYLVHINIAPEYINHKIIDQAEKFAIENLI